MNDINKESIVPGVPLTFVQARLSPVQAGGLPAVSRGLSASDTPGSSPESGSILEGCQPGRLALTLRPRLGSAASRTCSGGVVAWLLNPRLMAGIAPR